MTKSKKCNFRLTSIIILINVVLCAVISCLFKFNSDMSYNVFNNAVIMRREKEWNCIELYIKELYLRLDINMNDLSESAELGIRNQYKDLSVLKDELDRKDYRNLYNTISPFVEDKYFSSVKNDRNDIFVAVNDGIIADFSLSDIPYDYENETPTIQTWSEYIDRSSNKELTAESVNLILDQYNDIIFNEKKASTDENHTKLIEPFLSKMKEVYLAEGIDGLKNYTFLVPSYITDKGDIFGSKDIMYGFRHSTYKIILVQEFNIYDQITTNYPQIIDTTSYKLVDSSFSVLMNITSTIGFLMILEMIVCIMLSCIIFNTSLSKTRSSKSSNNKK